MSEISPDLGVEAAIENGSVSLRLFGAWGNLPCHLSIPQARMVTQELARALSAHDAKERELDKEYGPRAGAA